MIIICIGHDAAAPMPHRLNQQTEFICVHLGLRFLSPCSGNSSSPPAALSRCYPHDSCMRRKHSHGRSPLEEFDQHQNSGAWQFYLFPVPPLICLRHHSPGAARHSLHQACTNISQVRAWICISPLLITTRACTHRHLCTQPHTHTHTHRMRSQMES